MGLSFNGTTQAVTLPINSDAAQNRTGLTFMCWYKSTNIVGTDVLFSMGINPNSEGSYRFCPYLSAGKIRSIQRAPDSQNTDRGDGNGAITNGVLTHIAVVWDAANKTEYYYYNGVLQSTATTAIATNAVTDNTTTPKTAIGARSDGTALFADGSICDARLYSRLLTANEILTVYNSQGGDAILGSLELRSCLMQDAPGVAPSGTTIRDYSYAKRTGTPVNSPTWTADNVRGRRRRAA